MGKRERRTFTEEFKREAVRLTERFPEGVIKASLATIG